MMSKRTGLFFAGQTLLAAITAGAWLAYPANFSNNEPPAPIRSGVMTWAEASSQVAQWGEMRAYFRGETYGTTSAFTAVAVIKPGESVHPAHRHAEEEFLVITEGAGRWHLDGKEFHAAKGDVLYAAPWVMHGLVNTGEVPLTFFVAKWNSKGVKIPAAPAGPHGQ